MTDIQPAETKMDMKERLSAFLPHWRKDYDQKPSMRDVAAFHDGKREGYLTAILRLKSIVDQNTFENLRDDLMKAIPKELKRDRIRMRDAIVKKPVRGGKSILDRHNKDVMQMIMAGMPDRVIAEKYDLTHCGVAIYRKRHGIPSFYQAAKKVRTEKLWAEVWRLHQEGIANADIGRQLNISKELVWYILKQINKELNNDPGPEQQIP